MANQQNTQNNSKQQTRTLPKNFRQIGEPGTKKIYMEDYVYTYLNKLAQPGNLYARGAILFGNACQTPAEEGLAVRIPHAGDPLQIEDDASLVPLPARLSLDAAAEAVRAALTGGMSRAMNKFNAWAPPVEDEEKTTQPQ